METPHSENTAKTPASRYKKLTLYNAETKKNKVINIKIADFVSPEELTAYCERLKAENRKKNADFKYQKRREAIAQVITADVPDAPTVPAQLPETVNLNIDSGTGSTFLILGSSKRGKSTLAMHLYDKYYADDKAYISTLFSGNPHLRIYKNDKKLIIGYGFNDESANYIRMQQYLNVKTKNRYKFLNIFDDITDAKYNMVLKKSVLIYRNSQISSIICLQDPRDLEKKARASINHIFVFGCNLTENAKEIVDMVLRPYFIEMGVYDRDAMMRLFKETTANHGFFYIDALRSKMTMHRLAL